MSYLEYQMLETIRNWIVVGIVLFIVHMVFSATELYNIRRAIDRLTRRLEKRSEEEEPRKEER